MQKGNLKEYKIVREEQLKIKDCITSYLSFIIGGSGLAFPAIIMLSNNTMTSDFIIFACIMFSIIVSLILWLLFYKFTSHNRYAGYCKLLNQENWHKHFNNMDQLFCWEICMDLLRESKKNPKKYLIKARKAVEKYHNVQSNSDHFLDLNKLPRRLKRIFYSRLYRASPFMRKHFSKLTTSLENGSSSSAVLPLFKAVRGFQIMIRTFLRKNKSTSWNFAVNVTGAFFVLNFIFIFFAIYFYSCISKVSEPSLCKFLSFETPVYSILILYLVFQIFIWLKCFIRLFEQMEGSETIDSFCWIFLAIRYDYIKTLFPELDYGIITLK